MHWILGSLLPLFTHFDVRRWNPRYALLQFLLYYCARQHRHATRSSCSVIFSHLSYQLAQIDGYQSMNLKPSSLTGAMFQQPGAPTHPLEPELTVWTQLENIQKSVNLAKQHSCKIQRCLCCRVYITIWHLDKVTRRNFL